MRSSDPGRGASGRSRRGRKKARTREEILAAAGALFDREGVGPVTVGRVCAAADVARATFFLHFASKGALLRALDRRLAAELRDRLAEPRGSAVSEYRTAADFLAQRWTPPSDVLTALLAECLAGPTLASPGAEGQDLLAVVEEIVRRGQQRGELRRNVSARLAAASFLGASAAILSGAVYAEGEATSQEIRNQLLHAALHGLAEPKPRLKWRGGEASARPPAGARN